MGQNHIALGDMTMKKPVPTMNRNGELTGAGRCPHCEVGNPQLRRLWISEAIPTPDDDDVARRWAAFQCASCKHLVLTAFRPLRRGHALSQSLEVEWQFPMLPPVNESLPATARNYLQQASEILNAPDAAAIMATAAVDAMLKYKGLSDGPLYQRIDQAVASRLLTEGMAQWARAVRLEAFNVSHPDGSNPHLTRPQAEQVVEFAKALGEFLYVLTAKVEQGVKLAAAQLFRK
jgi:hypothetical protein